MGTQTFFSIFYLRFLLLKRLLFNKRTVAVWIPAFLFALSLFIFILYFLITKGIIATIISFIIIKDINVLPGVLFGLLVFISIFIAAYVLIVGTQLKDTLNYKKISFMPIKYFSFYLTEIVASFCDIWVLLIVPIFIGIIIGLGLFNSSLSISLTLSLLILFVVTIGVFNQLLVSLIEFLLKFNRINLMKSIFFLLFIILFSYLIISPIFLIGNDPGELSGKMTDILYTKKLYLTPIGLIVDALIKLVEKNYFKLVSFHFPLSLTYIFLILFTGYKISKFSPARKATAKSRSKSVIKLVGNIDNILNFFSRKSSVLLAKEIVYLLRSPRIKYFLILISLLIMAQLIKYASSNHVREILVISWLSYPFLVLVMDSGYMYSYDDNAVKFNFFSPYQFNKLIRAKNMSLLLLILLFQSLFYITILIIWSSIFAIKIILASFVLGCYIIFSNIIAINYFSISNPPKIKFNSTFGRSSSNAGLVFLSTLITLTPVITCFFIFHDSTLSLLASFMILCIISIILYVISLKPLSEKLAENQEYFIKQISG
jgi:hypothetical protein